MVSLRTKTVQSHGPGCDHMVVGLNYLCNQCLSLLTLWVRFPLRRGGIDTTLKLYGKSLSVTCDWLVVIFSPCTLVSSTSKTDCHDITDILLKVALSTITPYTNLKLYMTNHWMVSYEVVILCVHGKSKMASISEQDYSSQKAQNHLKADLAFECSLYTPLLMVCFISWSEIIQYGCANGKC